MADEPFSLDRLGDIPDPVAHVAQRPAPEPPALAEPSPTRPVRAQRSRAALVAGGLWVLFMAWRLGLRGDLHNPKVAIPLVLWALLAWTSLLFTLRPRARGLPAGVRAVQAVVLVVPLLFLVTAASTSPFEPLPEEGNAACVATASGIALAPLVLAALVLRRSFLSAPAWRGAAIGAACGLLGTIGVHAHCAVGGLLHVVVAHGVPIVLGAVVGATAGALYGRA